MEWANEETKIEKLLASFILMSVLMFVLVWMYVSS